MGTFTYVFYRKPCLSCCEELKFPVSSAFCLSTMNVHQGLTIMPTARIAAKIAKREVTVWKRLGYRCWKLSNEHEHTRGAQPLWKQAETTHIKIRPWPKHSSATSMQQWTPYKPLGLQQSHRAHVGFFHPSAPWHSKRSQKYCESKSPL